MERRLAIFGNPFPSYREKIHCQLIGWICEHRREASVIDSELSVLGNQVHGLSLIRGSPACRPLINEGTAAYREDSCRFDPVAVADRR
jgi:hypothetical protein